MLHEGVGVRLLATFGEGDGSAIAELGHVEACLVDVVAGAVGQDEAAARAADCGGGVGTREYGALHLGEVVEAVHLVPGENVDDHADVGADLAHASHNPGTFAAAGKGVAAEA